MFVLKLDHYGDFLAGFAGATYIDAADAMVFPPQIGLRSSDATIRARRSCIIAAAISSRVDSALRVCNYL